jgi:DNA repair photolyase
MGKLIYKPKGAALEYAQYAVNFYTGCSGGCSYCYNKKGLAAKILGADKPTLRKCFKNEMDAIDQFGKELIKVREEIKQHGLFLSFVGDPMCEESKGVTETAMFMVVYGLIAQAQVTILTKQTKWMETFNFNQFKGFEKNVNFGFTLTGHDEMEPGCAPNLERIAALKILKEMGFNTWVSLEPIIDFESSLRMFEISRFWTDKYKIGLASGKKYDKSEVQSFVKAIEYTNTEKAEIIWKESVKKYL